MGRARALIRKRPPPRTLQPGAQRLGTYGAPRGWAFSDERGTPVQMYEVPLCMVPRRAMFPKISSYIGMHSVICDSGLVSLEHLLLSWNPSQLGGWLKMEPGGLRPGARISETQMPGSAVERAWHMYRGTSPIRKRPPTSDPPRTLGIGLRQGPMGVRFLVSEVHM